MIGRDGTSGGCPYREFVPHDESNLCPRCPEDGLNLWRGPTGVYYFCVFGPNILIRDALIYKRRPMSTPLILYSVKLCMNEILP